MFYDLIRIRFSKTFGKQSCMVTLRNLIRITWMNSNLGHQADQSVLAQLKFSISFLKTKNTIGANYDCIILPTETSLTKVLICAST
jgi:hypothetical protein